MATLTHVDTHVIVWATRADDHDRLSARARRCLDEDDLHTSPMVRLELALLHEIGRLADHPDQVLGRAADYLGVREAPESLGVIVRTAIDLSWTRDPFDRLIAAHAIAANAQLLTTDTTMREHLDIAVW